MTMPTGSAEEPDVIITERESVPVHVVSTDAKPGKSIAPEFGRWRTFLVTSAVGNDMSTPGARKIANRSLRRHRLHIHVNSAGGTSGGPPVIGQGSATNPGAGANIAQKTNTPAGTYSVQWSVTLSGTVTAADANNMALSGFGLGAINAQYPGVPGTYPQLPFTVTDANVFNITVTAIAAASGAAAVYSAQFIFTPVGSNQPLTDGVIVGSREEIAALQPSNNPLAGYTPGGYLQIGDNVRWESQQELWVAYPPSNSLPVLISVCDEQYASDPESYRESR